MINYIGLTTINTFGTEMEIVEYNSSTDMIVEFKDERMVRKKTTLSNFNKGSILNPYDKTVYDIGYLGEGVNKASMDSKSTRVYYIWRAMLQRCYAESMKNVNQSYYGICKVCDEWKNFQNYADWHKENYYRVYDDRMHVDKDIIMTGNKVYDPNRCIIVPQMINVLFVNKVKEDGLPIGISKNRNGFYTVRYKGKTIGKSRSLKEAIYIHELARKDNVSNVADSIKDKLPSSVYMLLKNWEPII